MRGVGGMMYARSGVSEVEILQAPSPFTRMHYPYQVPFPNHYSHQHQATIAAAAEVQ